MYFRKILLFVAYLDVFGGTRIIFYNEIPIKHVLIRFSRFKVTSLDSRTGLDWTGRTQFLGCRGLY